MEEGEEREQGSGQRTHAVSPLAVRWTVETQKKGKCE